MSFCDLGKCWLFVTSGLCVNAQDELVYLLKCNHEPEKSETKVPRQILYHIMDMFDKTSKGFRIGPMNHVLYDFESTKLVAEIFKNNLNSSAKKNKNAADSKSNIDENNDPNDRSTLLENKENVGFLYFRPNVFQYKSVLKSIASYLPNEPFLIGYLIQRWETPFAKLFPLRLYLRLGEQFNCKLYSYSLK